METERLPTPEQLKSWDWTISETLSSYTEMAKGRKKVIQLLKLYERAIWEAICSCQITESWCVQGWKGPLDIV